MNRNLHISPCSDIGLVRFLWVLGLFVLTGCGDDPNNPSVLVPVRGSVLYDGKPLARAVVTFVPDKGNPVNVAATGTLDENGLFELSTGKRPGATLGKYKVTVALSPADEEAIQRNKVARTMYIDPKYRDADKTPISIQVESAPKAGVYDLKLTSN